MGHGIGDLPGIFIRHGTIDLYFHQLGNALAIFDQGPGQNDQEIVQHLLKRFCPASVIDLDPGNAAGHEYHRIIGAGIPVNGQPVQGPVHPGDKRALQQISSDVRIRCQKTKHGGHVRPDHPGPLGHPGNGKRPSVHLSFPGNHFGHRIRGHDRLGQIRYPSGCQLCHQTWNRGLDGFHGQRFTDHTGGGHQHHLFRDIQLCGHSRCHGLCICQSRLTRAAVGTSTVDHHGPAGSALYSFPVQQHRGGLDPVAGKYRCCPCRHP